MVLQRPSFRRVSSRQKRVPKSYFRTRAGFTQTGTLVAEMRIHDVQVETLIAPCPACVSVPWVRRKVAKRPFLFRGRTHSDGRSAGGDTDTRCPGGDLERSVSSLLANSADGTEACDALFLDTRRAQILILPTNSYKVCETRKIGQTTTGSVREYGCCWKSDKLVMLQRCGVLRLQAAQGSC